MGMTGFCVMDDHSDCPDTDVDEGTCDCPCHLGVDSAQYEVVRRAMKPPASDV